jgi:hypothetical protein
MLASVVLLGLGQDHAGAQRLSSRSRSTGTPGGVVVSHHTVELQADDEVQFRRKDPPPAYDDKGRPRRYTAAELKTLRGPDASLPGYPAEGQDLKVGQVVEVSLVKRQEDAKKDDAKNQKPARAGKAPPTPSYELVGVVTLVTGKGKSRKNTARKFNLRVETVRARGVAVSPITNDLLKAFVADKRVRTIMILSKDPPAR